MFRLRTNRCSVLNPFCEFFFFITCDSDCFSSIIIHTEHHLSPFAHGRFSGHPCRIKRMVPFVSQHVMPYAPARVLSCSFDAHSACIHTPRSTRRLFRRVFALFVSPSVVFQHTGTLFLQHLLFFGACSQSSGHKLPFSGARFILCFFFRGILTFFSACRFCIISRFFSWLLMCLI